jgi:hypothetical protein
LQGTDLGNLHRCDKMFRITLKNHRCFSESAPATIDLDEGFTAIARRMTHDEVLATDVGAFPDQI